MSEQRHIIKRQVIDLEIRGSANAQQIQADVSRIYRQRLIPLIDRYCTALSSPDRIHRIETLELDLGQLDPTQLEAEFVSGVRTHLQKVLAQKIAEQEQVARHHGEDTKSQSQLELLAFFMQTGSLPWWADTSQHDILEITVDQLFRSRPQQLRKQIAEGTTETRFLKRLVTHFADDALIRLSALLLSGSEAQAERVLRDLGTAIYQSTLFTKWSRAQLRQKIWSQLLPAANYVGGSSTATLTQFWQTMRFSLAQELEVSAQSLAVDLQQNLPENSPLADLLVQAQTLTDLTARPPSAVDDRRRTIEQATWPLLAQPPHTEQQELLSKGDLSFSLGDELYVDNAGLVILWPFLNHFFNHLNMLEGKQFKDSQSRQKAIGLLQYIATEATVFPEYLLPLNKILCGVDLLDLFEMESPITDKEKEEGNNLLQAIIAQATILRNMSNDGFRQTFLQREGVLRSRDGAWLLQVEHLTHDVVLDRFPWSWQWVKLPWMDTALRVEW